ncbi:hypothetical protein KCU81_g9886, partial [Aureobasidium melanogenum]|uniref:Uncharacterized protein n=2 Tax=Aureobasidium melanogenum TaxID=46634 RepID=A0A074W4U2_AURM1
MADTPRKPPPKRAHPEHTTPSAPERTRSNHTTAATNDPNGPRDLISLGTVLTFAKDELPPLLNTLDEYQSNLKHIIRIVNNIDPKISQVDSKEMAIRKGTPEQPIYTGPDGEAYLDPARPPTPESTRDEFSTFLYADHDDPPDPRFELRAKAFLPLLEAVKHRPSHRTVDLITGIYARIDALEHGTKFEPFNSRHESEHDANLVYIIQLLEAIADNFQRDDYQLDNYDKQVLQQAAGYCDQHQWRRVETTLSRLLKNIMGCWVEGQSTILLESAMQAHNLATRKKNGTGKAPAK